MQERCVLRKWRLSDAPALAALLNNEKILNNLRDGLPFPYTEQEERTITGITRYLQEHLAEELSLSVLAEQFHLNPQYISQLFKSEIGVNFLACLTSIRMEKAKKLLLSTSLSVAEVAEQSGYGDYRVFTKVFKKSEGITPSQYRRDFQSDVHLKI